MKMNKRMGMVIVMEMEMLVNHVCVHFGGRRARMHSPAPRQLWPAARHAPAHAAPPGRAWPSAWDRRAPILHCPLALPPFPDLVVDPDLAL